MTTKKDSVLEQLLLQLPLGIVYVDSERNIQEANQRFLDLSGYTRDEIIGKSSEIFYPSREVFETFGEKHYQELTQKGSVSLKAMFIAKNNQPRICDVRGWPLPPEVGQQGTLWIIDDITQQVKEKQRLKKDANNMKIVLELYQKAPGLHGRDLYEFALEKAIAATESEVGYIHRVDEKENSTIILTAWSKDTLTKCTASHETHYPLEKAGIWADSIRTKKPVIHNNYQSHPDKKGYPEGHFVILRHMGIPVIDEGEVKLVFGVGNKHEDYDENDVVQIQLIANELEKIVVHRRIEEEKKLLESKLRQSQKMEAIGMMAGGVAHDLNNILAGIVSYPELLIMQFGAVKELRQPLEAMQESGKRAAAVVQDLLTVARGIASPRELHSCNALIREFLSSPEYEKLHELYPEISYDVSFDLSLDNIYCSPIHVKKCIMNLILNAMEAIVGKGEITISTRNRLIFLEEATKLSIPAGDYAVIEVRDSGIGISEQDIQRIFEPFYSKKVLGRSGTGLGLTVVWNTVRDHNGTVSVESGKNGTVFNLYFPAVGDELEKSSPMNPSAAIRGYGEKLLVIDDEEQLRDIAKQGLEMLGYDVHSVANGEEAIEYLRDKSVDLLLLDMIMTPEMNGLRAYQEILKIHPNQKAIIVSGFSEDEAVAQTMALGAGAFVKKPYSIEVLGKAVAKELRRN